jgi:hypothetical protein
MADLGDVEIWDGDGGELLGSAPGSDESDGVLVSDASGVSNHLQMGSTYTITYNSGGAGWRGLVLQGVDGNQRLRFDKANATPI